ncbi:MAG: helix-turn-helix transcriptional regulator [Bacteroidales bacterium]|nr:helix-turn-helix transcriptional regulator [Bacteroidales bacterium]
MDRKDIRDAMFPDCPIRNVLSRITDKWTLLVLYTLEHENMLRFNEIKRAIPDISQKSLTVTLKSLEADGLVSRKVTPSVPVKVEYSLTERALSVMPTLDQLLAWSLENFSGIMADREKHTKE